MPIPSRIGLAMLALSAAPVAASAQSTSLAAPLAGGIRAGAAVSSWIGSGDATPHLGMALGGFVSIRLTPAFALQPELLLHDKGADFRDASGEAADEALLFAESMLLARLDRPLGELVSLYGVAGPGLAVLVDSKRTPREELRPIDLTLTVGAGVDLYTAKHYVSVDARGGLGLLDLRDDDRRARAWVAELLVGVTL
jgi:hypothetical protein